MDKKLLESLFYDGITPQKNCCPTNKEYHDTMQLCDTVEQEFTGLLSKDQLEMFQDYKEYIAKLTMMENAENFAQGIGLGIRITAEAFTLENNKME